MNGSIIRASAEHLDRCAVLFDQYRQFYGRQPDLPGARAFLEERLRREESAIYLALEEKGSAVSEPAGFMQLYPSFSSISMKRVWILNDLFVHPAYRGRGIGRRLLEAARRLAEETGAKGLSLSTAMDNRTAQKLYESFGFERDETFYHYDLLT